MVAGAGLWGVLEGTGVSAWHIWVIVGLVLFIAEILIPGFLVACFGVGCMAAALAAGVGGGTAWQLFAFSVGTLVVYFTIRPVVLRYLYPKDDTRKTNVDALVGRVGVVTIALDPQSGTGRVKVGGEDWRGVPMDDVTIDVGQRVEVVRVDGTKLLVRPVTGSKEG